MSRLGFGAGRLGSLGDDEAFALLDHAWGLGVRVFDTAPSYGRSEALLGQWRTSRRVSPVLSTKVGYGIPGFTDWTGPCVAAGIARALTVLQVERLDLVHLHSCPGAVALEAGVQRALQDAVRAGRVGVAAYSGENEDLDQVLSAGTFGGVQLSVNLCDQGSRELRLSSLASRGLTVLVKRPLAGAPWAGRSPTGPDDAEYARRFAALALEAPPEGWDSFALRFAAFSPGVTVALVGTTSPKRLTAYAQALAHGPLSPADEQRLTARWRQVAHGWRGIV
jgi:aryl-alcohol dehydrogenase-like predicted oxidoreductase